MYFLRHAGDPNFGFRPLDFERRDPERFAFFFRVADEEDLRPRFRPRDARAPETLLR